VLNRLVVAQNKTLDKLDPTMQSVGTGRKIERVYEEDGWTILELEDGWQLRFEHAGQLIVQPRAV
jgi:hypothetical protein